MAFYHVLRFPQLVFEDVKPICQQVLLSAASCHRDVYADRNDLGDDSTMFFGFNDTLGIVQRSVHSDLTHHYSAYEKQIYATRAEEFLETFPPVNL